MRSAYYAVIDKLYHYSIDHFVNYRRHLKEYFWAIVIALILRSTVITIYKIPTGSMIPTFNIGDVLIANRFYYGLKVPFTEGKEGWRIKIPGLYQKPGTGDIIIFRAPEEQLFYFMLITVRNDEALAVVRELNQASSFKRPHYVRNNITNYISLTGDLASEGNIMLHHSVYEKYREKIHNTDGLECLIRGRDKVYMTYKEHEYQGFWRRFLDTPITGLSIVATVMLNTPLAILPKAMLAYAFPNLHFEPFTLYPNKYVDTTKDFVKRIVAKGGDVVEIKNKILYINGVERKLQHEEIVESSEGLINRTFNVYSLAYTNEERNEVIRHKVQHRRENSSEEFLPFDTEFSFFVFDSNIWPYDPTVSQQYGYFLDDFGPITVPKEHYFALGDNRDESLDGRFWGCVPHWAIKGTAMFKIWPPGKIE